MAWKGGVESYILRGGIGAVRRGTADCNGGWNSFGNAIFGGFCVVERSGGGKERFGVRVASLAPRRRGTEFFLGWELKGCLCGWSGLRGWAV